jgi:hypothetical protein
MDSAINFNYQFRSRAVKINDKSLDDVLTTEFKSRQSFFP